MENTDRELITYLVQRGKINLEKGFSKGIDSIIDWDYMGATEYEFGALPASLKRVRSAESEYTYLDVPLKNKVISVFCKAVIKTQIKTFLTALSKGKMRTKMSTHFDSVINEEGYFKDKTNLWWDIENDLFFWVKNPDFELSFKNLIIPKQ